MQTRILNASLQAKLVGEIAQARDLSAIGDILRFHFAQIPDMVVADLCVRSEKSEDTHLSLLAHKAAPGANIVPAAGPKNSFELIFDGKCYGEISVTSKPGSDISAWMKGVASLVAMRLAGSAFIERKIDQLTGLLTRQEHDKRLISEAFADKGTVYYGIAEIDRIGAIHSDYGYAAVDELRVETAHRLQRLLGEDALLARLTENSFAFAIHEQSLNHSVESLGPRLLSEIAMPVKVGQFSVTVTASLGLARAPADSLRLDYLVKTAQRALKEIQEQGGNGVMLAEAVRSRTIDSASLKIRDALDHGEITAFLQPVYYSGSQDLAGFEALTRWRRPNGDVIGPAEYLGPIQRLGLSSKHCRCVIDALHEFVDLCPKGAEGLHLSINAASHELSDPELVHDLCVWGEAMRERGFVPVVEVNEDTEVLSGDEGISGAVIRLAASGAKISMDDFGTGAGSATRLLSIPAHQLKIDRRFVRIMHEDPRGMAVIRALLVLAEGFGMDTVAEGVETKADCDTLRAMGCTMLQGFFYDPALPVERALDLVHDQLKSSSARASAAG